MPINKHTPPPIKVEADWRPKKRADVNKKEMGRVAMRTRKLQQCTPRT